MTQANGQSKRSLCIGESMIMVVIMMLAFFILGAAVMTAASTATAGASARVVERQGYYYARAMMDTIDDSLQKGELGKALDAAIIADISGNPTLADTAVYTPEAPFTLRFRPVFEDATLNEALEGAVDGDTNNITISCVGRGYVVRDGEDAIREVVFNRFRVTLSYTCTYRGIDTSMYIQYRYTCRIQNYGKESETWQKEWEIQSAG